MIKRAINAKETVQLITERQLKDLNSYGFEIVRREDLELLEMLCLFGWYFLESEGIDSQPRTLLELNNLIEANADSPGAKNILAQFTMLFRSKLR